MQISVASVAVAAVLVVVGLWAWNTHLSPDAKARRASAMAATAQLREAVLSRMMLNAPGQAESPKAFAMDWHVGAGQLATLVAFDDGTTSLYFSSGGGVIGAGEVPTVRPVAERFRAAFGGLESHFHAIETWPPPAPSSFIFNAIDRNATRATMQLSTGELQATSHPLHSVAKEAQNLMSAIRTAKPLEESRK